MPNSKRQKGKKKLCSTNAKSESSYCCFNATLSGENEDRTIIDWHPTEKRMDNEPEPGTLKVKQR